MLSDSLQLYWGDAHTNLRPHHFDRLEDSFRAARDVLDFWPVAYYPFLEERIGGCRVETAGQRDLYLEQWQRLCRMTASCNESGRFVCFPGYEWHGDRCRWGDHNVFYRSEPAPLDAAGTLTELYGHLRENGGIAIPHHTAYKPGWRGKDWSVHDDGLSPFAEIFSSHGSSEGYGGPLPMDRNMVMGPMDQAGSLQAGLAAGRHFGIIASGDIHAGYPTQWGTGVMACYAQDLTRDALWESFAKRRVYAVTGDRIKLDLAVGGLPMGAIGQARPPYRIEVNVEGSDAVSRIELLRNNVVIEARHFPFDPGAMPTGEARYKLRAFFGWGPVSGLFDRVGDRPWRVELAIENGTLLGVERMWNRFGQRVDRMTPSGCQFRLTTGPGEYSLHANPPFQGMGFEIKGTPDSRLHFVINGRPHAFSLREARQYPTIVADMDGAEAALREAYGVTPESLARDGHGANIVYAGSYRTHLWPAVHENEFRQHVIWEDAPDRPGESWYYVRVIQANGQIAWSSPVWVTAGKPT